MAAGPYQVVVVPGFGGTELTYAGGFGGKTTYWYSPRRLASNNPLTGALAADGVSPYPLLGKTLKPAGPVALGIYEPLITGIANAGYNPTFWGYDWRLSAQVLAQQLATYLATATLSNPFQLVCHSYGGLIAQLAYPLYQAANPTATWKQTVYLGTPHGGTYWAAAALAGWFPRGSELALLATVFKLAPPNVSTPIGLVSTALQVAIGELVGSWPGLYCLLPNTLGPWNRIDNNAVLLNSLESYAATWGGQQQQWFSLAVSTFSQLVVNLGLPRPKETSIVGVGYSTLAGYEGEGSNPSQLESYSNKDGDGTVVKIRASLPNTGETVTLVSVGHNELCTSLAGVDEVTAALASPPLANDTVPFVPPSTIPFPPTITPAPPVLNRNPFANVHADP